MTPNPIEWWLRPVMIAARRRTQGRRIEVGVAQAVGGDPVKIWRRDHTAERAGDAEAGIVSHDQQDVRRSLGGNDARGPVRRRLRGVALNFALELLWRRRNLV